MKEQTPSCYTHPIFLAVLREMEELGVGGGVLKPRGNRIEKGKEKKGRTTEWDRR